MNIYLQAAQSSINTFYPPAHRKSLAVFFLPGNQASTKHYIIITNEVAIYLQLWIKNATFSILYTNNQACLFNGKKSLLFRNYLRHFFPAFLLHLPLKYRMFTVTVCSIEKKNPLQIKLFFFFATALLTFTSKQCLSFAVRS